jgi:hypothetical protein
MAKSRYYPGVMAKLDSVGSIKACIASTFQGSAHSPALLIQGHRIYDNYLTSNSKGWCGVRLRMTWPLRIHLVGRIRV